MQRTVDGGVIISCDFCGTDWDQIKPMVEGHRGSVICLVCLEIALADAQAGDSPFSCTLCLREELDATLPHWPHADRDAVICQDCIHQAARQFSKDKDIDWTWPRP